MKLSEYDKVISAYKTYISDFWYRWPQVRSFLRPPHYKSMGKKSTPLYLFWRKPIWVLVIISYRTVVDNSNKNLHCIPLERSFDVTRGHQPSFANNFWSKRDRDMRLASGRSSWPGESNDMQYDPLWPSRDLGLTTWVQTLTLTFQSHFICGSTRLNETNTMVSYHLTRQTRW